MDAENFAERLARLSPAKRALLDGEPLQVIAENRAGDLPVIDRQTFWETDREAATERLRPQPRRRSGGRT